MSKSRFKLIYSLFRLAKRDNLKLSEVLFDADIQLVQSCRAKTGDDLQRIRTMAWYRLRESKHRSHIVWLK